MRSPTTSHRADWVQAERSDRASRPVRPAPWQRRATRPPASRRCCSRGGRPCARSARVRSRSDRFVVPCATRRSTCELPSRQAGTRGPSGHASQVRLGRRVARTSLALPRTRARPLRRHRALRAPCRSAAPCTPRRTAPRGRGIRRSPFAGRPAPRERRPRPVGPSRRRDGRRRASMGESSDVATVGELRRGRPRPRPVRSEASMISTYAASSERPRYRIRRPLTSLGRSPARRRPIRPWRRRSSASPGCGSRPRRARVSVARLGLGRTRRAAGAARPAGRRAAP